MTPLSAPMQRQFSASLAMLREAIKSCPDDLYREEQEGAPFWHLAYHTLFYIDLYLGKGESEFVAAHFHKPTMNFLKGEYPHPPFKVETPKAAPSKGELLDYLDRVEERMKVRLHNFGESWFLENSAFEWLPMSRGELVLYTLRHTAHHTGQLNGRLREAGVRAAAWG